MALRACSEWDGNQDDQGDQGEDGKVHGYGDSSLDG